jgi:glycerophosphoryl diester phosphodiesterase
MVELKRPRGDAVERALRLLDDEDVVVSFQRRALEETRALRPSLRTIQHVGFGVSIRRAADAWAAGFQNERVTPRGLAAARALGLETTVYTVNDTARLLELRDLGVTGVFTDDPRRALAALGRADVPSPR